MKQQIDSFNHFVERSMRAIVMASDNCRHTCDADPDWFVQYTDVHVGHPTEMVNYIERPLTPHGCRLRDMTYSAPITVRIQAQELGVHDDVRCAVLVCVHGTLHRVALQRAVQ